MLVGTLPGNDLSLLADTGNVIAKYHGYSEPIWLDDSHFVASNAGDWSSDPTQLISVPGISVDAASGALTSTTLPCCITLGNGHGAIAAAHYGTPKDGVEQPAYVIWTTTGQSAEREGLPVAWSRDGSKLAVIHPTGGLQGADGWLEVFSWPELRSLYQSDHSQVVSGPTFDPTSTEIMYENVPPDGSLEAHVVTVPSGDVGIVNIKRDGSSVGWDSRGNLLVAESNDDTLTTYGPDGSQIGSRSLPGSGAMTTSDDGTTLVTHDLDSPTSVAYDRGGVGGQIDLPPGGLLGTALSPTGRHLVVVVAGADATAFLTDLK